MGLIVLAFAFALGCTIATVVVAIRRWRRTMAKLDRVTQGLDELWQVVDEAAALVDELAVEADRALAGTAGEPPRPARAVVD